MGEEKTQEAIKPEPILFGWRREKEFKDGIKPESVMSKWTIVTISLILFIIFNILFEDSFFSMIFAIIALFGSIKQISENERKKEFL
jgi:hypothetical protein